MKNYKKLANEARKKVLELVHKAGTSHIASNFSVTDIATVLYENIKEGDEVVWSKGWSAATIYYFLWKQGKITEEQLNSFPNPPFLGLAETTVPGVWCNGGSVGHGLGVAVGMALGKKRAGEKGTIYCIMSDGELNEGSIWEATMFAAHHKLDNLVAIIDKNGWQAMGRTKEILDIDIQQAFNGFGWLGVQINGHNYGDLEWAILNESVNKGYSMNEGHPSIVVAKTIKGKGVSFFEDKILYHYAHTSLDDFNRAMTELCTQVREKEIN